MKGLIVAVVFMVCVSMLYWIMGCSGWRYRHNYEEVYDGVVGSQVPQFDTESGEAYARTYDLYKHECTHCGERSLLRYRYEPLEEHRWESDTVRDIHDTTEDNT